MPRLFDDCLIDGLRQTYELLRFHFMLAIFAAGHFLRCCCCRHPPLLPLMRARMLRVVLYARDVLRERYVAIISRAIFATYVTCAYAKMLPRQDDDTRYERLYAAGAAAAEMLII